MHCPSDVPLHLSIQMRDGERPSSTIQKIWTGNNGEKWGHLQLRDMRTLILVPLLTVLLMDSPDPPRTETVMGIPAIAFWITL
jgi:hypothetical protein